MEERGVFDGLRIWLLSPAIQLPATVWITGVLAFLLSTVISGMAVGLLLGAVAAAVGKYKKEFVALACVNIVRGDHAGGSLSPLAAYRHCSSGKIKSCIFMSSFLWLCHVLVNFLVACSRHALFSYPKETPAASTSTIWLRRGSKRVIILFVVTLAYYGWSISFCNCRLRRHDGGSWFITVFQLLSDQDGTRSQK